MPTCAAPPWVACLNWPKGVPGLSNVLARDRELASAIHKTDQGFDVLPVGLIPANPQELISSARFREVLKQLAGQYDRDHRLDPINAVSDALILATQADSLVYVVKADVTPASVVKKT